VGCASTCDVPTPGTESPPTGIGTCLSSSAFIAMSIALNLVLTTSFLPPLSMSRTLNCDGRLSSSSSRSSVGRDMNQSHAGGVHDYLGDAVSVQSCGLYLKRACARKAKLPNVQYQVQ
jgi:hypothetical protein